MANSTPPFAVADLLADRSLQSSVGYAVDANQQPTSRVRNIYYWIDTTGGRIQTAPNVFTECLPVSQRHQDYIINYALPEATRLTGFNFIRTQNKAQSIFDFYQNRFTNPAMGWVSFDYEGGNQQGRWWEDIFSGSASNDFANNDDLATIGHEVGHALGLSHPRQEPGTFPFGKNDSPPTEPTFTRETTVMSYNSLNGDLVGGNTRLTTLDQAALAQLWGTTVTTPFFDNSAPVATINKAPRTAAAPRLVQGRNSQTYGKDTPNFEVIMASAGGNTFDLNPDHFNVIDAEHKGNNSFKLHKGKGYEVIKGFDFKTDRLVLPEGFAPEELKAVVSGDDTQLWDSDSDLMAVVTHSSHAQFTQGDGIINYTKSGADAKYNASHEALIRLVNPTTGIHSFILPNAKSIAAADPAAVLEGSTLDVLTQGGKPLYAFKNNDTGSSLFTMDAKNADKYSHNKHYTALGSVFHGYQPGSTLGTTNVYGFTGSNGDHIYTSDSTEKEGLMAAGSGYHADGVIWRV